MNLEEHDLRATSITKEIQKLIDLQEQGIRKCDANSLSNARCSLSSCMKELSELHFDMEHILETKLDEKQGFMRELKELEIEKKKVLSRI